MKTNRLGIDLLSVLGMPPVEFVNLAADLGCHYISTGLSSGLPFNPHGYAPFSLRDDAALRREMIAAMRDRNVSISLGEGFAVRGGVDTRDCGADLDVMAELGITVINAVSMEPDQGRSFEQLGILVGLAASRGMVTTIEFVPGLAIADLPTALKAIQAVGSPDFRLLIDMMHLVRSGGGAKDIAALDPASIGYIQLCDVPLVPKTANYMQEAMCSRLAPGKGELPLLDILAALPRDQVIGLEVPMLAEAQAGIGPQERLAPCVEAARKLLAQLDKKPA